MGLFQDVYCADCGGKTNAVTRTRLADKQYLCPKCTGRLSSVFQFCLNKDCTLEQYRQYKEYMAYSSGELKNLFHETNFYYGLHLDSVHGLFYLDEYTDKNTYFKLCNLSYFDLIYKADEAKEGIIHDKVTGRIHVMFIMTYPTVSYTSVLADRVKSKAEINLFRTKVTYENPKEMDDFLLYFNAAWQNAQIHSYSGGSNADAAELSEIQAAMALFMLDSLEGVTLDQLKEQRNRLIKTFHPDMNEEADNRYAQKINAAFDVLRAAIGA